MNNKSEQPTGQDKPTVIPKCTLPDNELIEKCREWISKLCKSGGKAWTLRVPVDLERDPDILLSEVIDRYEQLQQENKRLKEELTASDITILSQTEQIEQLRQELERERQLNQTGGKI